jgi:hypothetical protein
MSTIVRSTHVRRTALSITIVAIAAVSLLGCSQKYNAERDGKNLGEAVCDLKNASSAEEAQSALAKVESEMSSLANNYAIFTAEDRADIKENLNDLREHVSNGNQELIHQDLTVIRRSLSNVAADLDDTGQAAWDGVKEGVDDCVSN